MHRDRLKTVAHALATLDKKYDPTFDYRRYAVLATNADGPDVPLERIGVGVRIDIAAMACFQYPDLCKATCEGWAGSPMQAPAGLLYWHNAKRILGLSAQQADDLFLGLCSDLGGSLPVADAIMALEKLAHSPVTAASN